MSAVGDLLLVLGAAWAVVAAVGALTFRDTLSRMHAATKSPTLALLVVLIGAALHLSGPDAVKLGLVGLLVFVTVPVGAHLVGHAVHRAPGDTPVRIDTIDELADARRDAGDTSPREDTSGEDPPSGT